MFGENFKKKRKTINSRIKNKEMKIKKPTKKDLYKKEKRLKKRLQVEADVLWHLAVIKKYGDRCFFAGKTKQALNCPKVAQKCHHYFPKGRYPELRYEITNGVPICWPDHYKAEKIDRTMLADILRVRDEEWYNKLNKIRFERKSWSSFETTDYYRKIIKELE